MDPTLPDRGERKTWYDWDNMMFEPAWGDVGVTYSEYGDAHIRLYTHPARITVWSKVDYRTRTRGNQTGGRMNLKCYAPRLPGSKYKYRALLIDFVPAVTPEATYVHAVGDKTHARYTVDALVILQEFSKGHIVQVPAFEVRVVTDWEDDE